MSKLIVKDLNVSIKVDDAYFSVLNDVSFELDQGVILGVVGESGCGKTMLAYALQGLLPEVAKVESGQCYFGEKEINLKNSEAMRRQRKHNYSMIFQNPMSALNPLMRVGQQVAEALPKGTKDVKKRVCDMFTEMKLRNPEQIYEYYPHQLSGGMRQRIMIAMALIASPKFLIADEPTTALDVTTEARILKLMQDLLKHYEATMLFISHDLAVIKSIANQVAIMYAGEIVEFGTAEDIFSKPSHPYTRGLLNSRPTPADKGKKLKTISGTVPALEKRNYQRCVYYDRCPDRIAKCESEKPECKQVGNHFYKCHLGDSND